jgi:geranylgeranyl pyrophosphate synthase
MVAKTLEKTRELVWPEIKKYLKDPSYPKQFSIHEKYKEIVNYVWQINRDYPERMGKYLRPTLLRLIFEAMGGKTSECLKVASAMQLSEDWILIHDDVEDKSLQRRGKQALHGIYGDELAINAGDTLHVIMWKILNDQGSKAVNDEFHKILMRTTLGQGVELTWTGRKIKTITKEDYFFMADSKSGYYSIAGPMRLGAILARANNNQLDKLTEFGLHLGRCFQLVDDILDLNQDKKEGKITLATTKGVPYTKKLATEEKNLAKEIFDKDLGFLSKEPARKELNELIEFIFERKY